MFKVYKKTVVLNHERPSLVLEQDVNEPPVLRRFSKLLAIPGMIVGGVLMAIFFSAVFALLLIPAAILGFRAWKLMRAMPDSRVKQTLDAEYKVIDDTTKE